MGFRKRLRKRFAKLTRLSKRKSTTASARSNSAALMTIKEEISGKIDVLKLILIIHFITFSFQN